MFQIDKTSILKTMILKKFTISPVIAVLVLLYAKAEGSSERPIIGVFCHELSATDGCYIAASYVKAVEAAGARVAPIFLWRSPHYYRRIVRSLNGVVFPGGDAKYDVPGGYYQSAQQVYQHALEVNARGVHFPVLGVCLGHEFLSRYSSGPAAVIPCPGVYDVMLPLHFTSENSSLYGSASPEILRILATQNVTVNFHEYCIRPNTLSDRWKILTLNKDGNGTDFVSSMEDRQAPIVGIQFHPEKNAYEWQKNHPHSKDALLASRHFYDWLVTEAHRNNHSFRDPEEELDSLIYNYSPTYTGRNGSVFTQKYIFPGRGPEPTVRLANV